MPKEYLPKVLIVAPNASARFGGEAILPLHYFRLLSKRGYPVKLLTHHRNQAELYSLASIEPNQIHFVPDTKWHKMAWTVFSKLPERVRDLVGASVLNWLNEIYQAKIIRQLVERGEVELIHQPTPVSPLTPSGLHRFGLPLIIGPMNGGMNYPDGYQDYEGLGTRFIVAAGRRLAMILNWISPAKLRATVLLVANERTRLALPDPNLHQIETLVENGIDFNLWTGRKRKATTSPVGSLKLIYMGRFIKLKGVDITLHAVCLARAQGREVTLELVGDGEEREKLEQLTSDLGLQDHVTFHGFQPQQACATIMAECDALVLNSLRECGGAVVLEAMATGIPVVASAWGGPMDYITRETGVLISPTPRENFAQRLADTIIYLADHPDIRESMGNSGEETARRMYDWETKIDQIIKVYKKAV